MHLRGLFVLPVLFFPWAASSAAGSEALDYSIGVSDELSVDIRNLGQSEYSFDVRVPRNGRISIPLLGEILIRGHTIQQTEILLESRLRDGYLKQPEVTIRVTEFRPFFIDGAVESPGAYPYQHGLTVEKAIVLAGGLSEFADEANITVSSENNPNEEKTIDVTALVAPGDIITIDESYSTAENIYLYGAVNSPGAVGYKAGLTVEKAIVLAGGFSPRASKRKIKIKRGTGDEIEEIKRVKLSAGLQPGDIITIGESLF